MIKTPLKKMKKNTSTVLFYLMLMILSYGFVYIYEKSDVRITQPLLTTIHIVFALHTLFFLLSWFKDPGYLKKDTSIDF